MVTYNNIISRTDAAALIPEEVSALIGVGVIAQSAALQKFRHVQMSRAQQRIPVVAALPTAYFVGGDTGLKQTTEVNWANKYLNVEEIAAIVPIPEAVLDDTAYDVWAAIRPLCEEAIGRVLDAAVFFGTNKPASWPNGIATDAAAAGNSKTRNTTAANGGVQGDLSALFSLIEADGYDVNGLIASRTYRGLLRNVRDTTGQLVADPTYGVGITYPMRGIWPAPTTGAVEAIAGDFSEGILGMRQDMTYKILDQAVIQDGAGAIQFNLAQQDMVALRIVARYAWQVANVINRDQPVEASRYPFGVMLAP